MANGLLGDLSCRALEAGKDEWRFWEFCDEWGNGKTIEK